MPITKKLFNQLKTSQLLFMVIILNYLIWFVTIEVFVDYSFIKKIFLFSSIERINKVYLLVNRYTWLLSLVFVAWFLIKAISVAICIEIGALMKNIKISFKTIIKIICFAEFVNILALVINGLASYKNNGENIDTSFSLYSVINKFVVENSWLTYPTSIINIYLAFYFLIIIHLIKIESNMRLIDSFKFVFTYLGLGLLLWVLCMTTFSLYYT